MCNRYRPAKRELLPQPFRDLPTYGDGYAESIGPRQPGPYVLRDRVVVGQWGLIPWFAKEPVQKDSRGRPLMTNNARSETIATRPTFRDAWKAGQRCLIPAEAFMEPYWGPVDALFGKCAWWTFSNADGGPWMLAGLYNDWKDPETGEIVPSYTLVTMNADHHPLMKLMHKPERDPTTKVILAPEKQDKRSVVPLMPAAWNTWLAGTPDEAMATLELPPVTVYKQGAEDPSRGVVLSM